MNYDIEMARTHAEDQPLAQDAEYHEWLDMLNDEPKQYIIWKRCGEYLAYEFSRYGMDGCAFGLMPGSHEDVWFSAGCYTVIDCNTRSFAYALAIVEYIEDDELLSQPIDKFEGVPF